MGDPFDNRFRFHTAERVLKLKIELDKIATHNLQDLESLLGVMPMDKVRQVRDQAWNLQQELEAAQRQLKFLEFEAGEVNG